MFDYERAMENRVNRRSTMFERAQERLERRERDALFYVGELCREGDVIYYINVRSQSGNLTGQIKEFDTQYQAINYLIRNNYV